MKTIFWILILLMTACSSAAMDRDTDTGGESELPATDLNRVAEGVYAPDFTLESTDNEQITLSSYRDKKNVVLVFYRGYW
jgi:cytochrome oxidase Cu insertion factor (SCO1/SenC/PrrC family)